VPTWPPAHLIIVLTWSLCSPGHLLTRSLCPPGHLLIWSLCSPGPLLTWSLCSPDHGHLLTWSLCPPGHLLTWTLCSPGHLLTCLPHLTTYSYGYQFTWISAHLNTCSTIYLLTWPGSCSPDQLLTCSAAHPAKRLNWPAAHPAKLLTWPAAHPITCSSDYLYTLPPDQLLTWFAWSAWFFLCVGLAADGVSAELGVSCYYIFTACCACALRAATRL
jgi:hypothetical protein